ncbi:MAG: acyl-CoA dehydrogenase family protein [Proteobacteria bacterium]|nr:acyl-CoA dehydrogenase family protein [Pseudomonadota bacterium]MBU1452082.1 acyl-CoA dehydrogenase family protein [Pseudomonadota bacterium]MBU2467279.1 acyl-CoA dehydrogenase family protein [Pseudomonadota bacterium]MBU2517364.1 acyl-CoA dehydrogenase family protein [Pseudomonadota bacterium]
MNFGYTDEEERFRQELAVFLDKHLTEEIARQNWEDKGVGPEAREFSRKLAAYGFLGMGWPEEYGGKGLPPAYDFILLDELGKRWGAHVPLDVGYTMVGHTILRRGSEAMKKEFLPKIVGGEIEFCLGYTEPNAGSDLAAMMMRAEDKGDHFLISGQKTFNTECHYADYHWLAARTDFSPQGTGYKGVSLFIVDMDAPGVTVRPLWTMSGERTNEVYYDEVKVPRERLVGEKNKGFYYMMEALGSERNQVFVPSRLRPVLNMLLAYAQETRYQDRPLSKDPVVRRQLARAAVELEVAEVVADHSRWLEALELPMTHQPEMTKVMVSELEQRLVNAGMRILGPYGQLEEGSPWAPLGGRIEWYYLHSFMTTIGAGTSEIGRNVIAQRGLGLPRG